MLKTRSHIHPYICMLQCANINNFLRSLTRFIWENIIWADINTAIIVIYSEHVSEVIESFFLAESESEYYSSIRKFSNPNPNIIRDFKKDSNIFESLKRFEYSKIIRIIQLFLNKIWKIKSRKQELRKHIQKAPKGIKWQSHPSTGLVHWCPQMGSAGRLGN